MLLHLFGISLVEATSSPGAKIKFKPPVLTGWVSPSANIEIDTLSVGGATGVLHFTLSAQNTKKTLTLAISFDIMVTRQGEDWFPAREQAAGGTQTLQVASEAAHDSLELRFGLLNIPAQVWAHPAVAFYSDSQGEIFASPSVPLDVLDPAQLGVLRLRLDEAARIYLRLDATPRLRVGAGSLNLVPVLRDTAIAANTVELAPHPCNQDLELLLVVGTADSKIDINFDAPASSMTPSGENFMLPLGTYPDEDGSGTWLAPITVSDYVLKTRWKIRTRAMQWMYAGVGQAGSQSVAFMRCLDDTQMPFHLIAATDIELSACLRATKSGVLARLGIKDSIIAMARSKTPPNSRFALPVPGLSFTVGELDSPVPFGDLVSTTDAQPPPSPFGLIDPAFVTGDSLQLISVLPGGCRVVLDADNPYHEGWHPGVEPLKAYGFFDLTYAKTILLPACGLDAHYVAAPDTRASVIDVLDTALRALIIRDSNGNLLQHASWLRPDNIRVRRSLSSTQLDADIGIEELYANVMVSGEPSLRLQPHQLRQKVSLLESISEQTLVLKSERLSGAFVVRDLSEFDWVSTTNPQTNSPLEQSNVFSLSYDKQEWISSTRPPPSELPYAIVRTSTQAQRLGDILRTELQDNPIYNYLYDELNDLEAFPTWWIGTVLLEVEAKLEPDSIVGAAFGADITFKYIGFAHSFDINGPLNLKVTKAYAHPADFAPSVPSPPINPRICGLYSVLSRSVRIRNHSITTLDMHGKVYLFSFLGLSLKNNQADTPLQVDVMGQYDALRAELVVSNSIPIAGIQADLGSGIAWKYWPFERIRLTSLSVRFVLASRATSLQLLLNGELDVRSNFAELIRRDNTKPLQFRNIQLVSLIIPPVYSQTLPAPRRLSTPGKGQFEEPLTLVYLAAKWILDSADFSLGTRLGVLTFNGMNYSLDTSIELDFLGTLPIYNQSPAWSSLGYVALRFTLDLRVSGSEFRALPGATLEVLLTWPIGKDGAPILDQPAIGLRFSGLNSFVLPLFPGLELVARSFTMNPVDIPGTMEKVPWFALRDMSLHSNWGDMFDGSSLSAGMFIRSDSRSGFAALWRQTQGTNAVLEPHWLLIAQNMSLPPGYQWAQEMLEPKSVGDIGTQDDLAKELDRVIGSGTHEPALQPLPDAEHYISRWLVAGGFTVKGGLVGAKFFHQDGAFTGITLDGPLVKSLLGGKAVSLTYKKGMTTDEDIYELVIDLPSLSMAAFEAHGGHFRLRLSPSGGFLIDGAYPFPDSNGFRDWSRATSLTIMGFRAQGGFYVARYRGLEPIFKTINGTDRTLFAFGVAASWGRSFNTTEGGWFRAKIFIGFFGLFEGTLVYADGDLHIARLIGAGGVLLTAKASISLWIISASLTISAYAELRVEYQAPPRILQLAGMNVPKLTHVHSAFQKADGGSIKISATFALNVTFEVEIDMYLFSYTTSVSATYVLEVGETIPV